MCKLKGKGKRCPTTPQRKEAENYRQKVKYYAKNAEMSSKEWLETNPGKFFAKHNDPKILNPNWEKEHRASLKALHSPQVTMDDNFISHSANLEILRANFPSNNERRGVDTDNRDMYYHTDEDEYAEGIVQFNAIKQEEFSKEEADALRKYTSNDHLHINHYLRQVTHNQDMTLKDFGEKVHNKSGILVSEIDRDYYRDMESKTLNTIHHLDAVLSQRRTIEKPELSYRAITSEATTAEVLESYKPNAMITFDNYSSTSHSLVPSLQFSTLTRTAFDHDKKVSVLESMQDKRNIIFEIQTNAGMSVVEHTDYVHEKEILLPRGINFKVVNSYAPSEENPYKITRYSETDECEIQNDTIIVQLAECDEDGNILKFNETKPIIPKPLKQIVEMSDKMKEERKQFKEKAKKQKELMEKFMKKKPTA